MYAHIFLFQLHIYPFPIYYTRIRSRFNLYTFLSVYVRLSAIKSLYNDFTHNNRVDLIVNKSLSTNAITETLGFWRNQYCQILPV